MHSNPVEMQKVVDGGGLSGGEVVPLVLVSFKFKPIPNIPYFMILPRTLLGPRLHHLYINDAALLQGKKSTVSFSQLCFV